MPHREVGGRFVILESLGRGGMGEVSRAYDTTLKREVALKHVHTEAGSERGSRARQRLLREAEALARLRHPNVVAVYDVIEREGEVLVAMELVAGETLRTWLEAKRPPADVLAVFLAAGEGLAAAHDVGLVHADFKPDNVMVGKDGRVQLVDFGLARWAQPDPAPTDPKAAPLHGESDATSHSHAAGTPRYMAPEQWLEGRVDARADQFTFCVALYEALWGGHPLLQDTPRDATHADAPPRIVIPPLRGWRHGRAVAKALERGLETEPAARFPSLRALLAALRPRSTSHLPLVVACVAVAIATTALFVRARPVADPCARTEASFHGIWDRESRARVGAAFRAPGLADAESLLAHFDANIERRLQAWAAMQEDACRATRVRAVQSERMMDLRMACLDRSLAEMRSFVTTVATSTDRNVLLRAVLESARLPPLDACADTENLGRAPRWPRAPELRGASEAIAARIDALRGQTALTPSMDLVERAKSIVADAAPLGSGTLPAEALLLLGDAQDGAGKAADALATYFRAAEAAGTTHDDQLAAQAWSRALQPLAALSAYEQLPAVEAMARASVARVGSPTELTARLFGKLAWIERERSHYDDAKASYEKAILLARQDPSLRELLASLLDGLGSTNDDRGAYDVAEQNFRESLEARRDIVGPNHPGNAMLLVNHAAMLLSTGEVERAERLLQDALAIQDHSLAPDNPRRGIVLGNLAEALRLQHRYEEARSHLLRAQELFSAAYGPQSRFAIQCVDNLGRVALESGRSTEALTLLEQARAGYVAALGADAAQVAYVDEELAQVLLELHRPKDAMRRAEAGLSALKPDEGAYRVSAAEFTLARALWEANAGRPRARALATSALDRLKPLAPRFAKERSTAEAWLHTHAE